MIRLAALLLALVVAAGCQTLTGRSAGQWVDDRAVTAKVKSRLASEDLANLTRVHVDTYEGVVYLTGGVDSARVKDVMETVARSVADVRLVVNNLHVVGDAIAASPSTAAVSQAPPLEAIGIARLEVESGTPGWTQYGGYDAGGRRLATVYAVASSDVSNGRVADLPARTEGVRADVYPEPGGSRSFLVLWHEPGEWHPRDR